MTAKRIYVRPKGERKPPPLKLQPATNAELNEMVKEWRRVEVDGADVYRVKPPHYHA